MQPISPSLRRYHLDNVGYISFQLMCDFINVRVNYISGLSALIWTTFANSFSHLLWLQGDDMHRTTAFSRSPRAPTQCVLSIYYEARTWHRRCRTRVGRGGTRRRTRDAATRASGRVRLRHATWRFRFFSRLAPTRLQLGPIRTESGRLGPYRQISAETAETADSGRNGWYGRN